MDNYVSYSAGGKSFKIASQLKFGDFSDEQIARYVFLEVSSDRNTRLANGEIPLALSKEESQCMSDTDIFEWYCTTQIVFFDYRSKKKLSMNRMSDFLGSYTIEVLNDKSTEQ